MTGVSYMIPFVAAGGLLIALGFLLGGYEIAGPDGAITVDNSIFNLPDTDDLGLEHALVGRARCLPRGDPVQPRRRGVRVPGPGAGRIHRVRDRRPSRHRARFVMGALAARSSTGFIGGIVGGVIAGFAALWISGWKVPTWARGLMPVLVIPLFATLIAGLRDDRDPRQAALVAHGASSRTASTA